MSLTAEQEKVRAERLEAAKDHLDLIRATINTLTWVALCGGACLLLWKISLERQSDTVFATISGVVMFVAAITAVGAVFSLVVLSVETGQKWKGRGPRLVRLSLFYHSALWMVFLGIAIIAIIGSPFVRQVFPAVG